jgi:hypothetical protein
MSSLLTVREKLDRSRGRAYDTSGKWRRDHQHAIVRQSDDLATAVDRDVVVENADPRAVGAIFEVL